jgi:CBS domain-containing protein
MKKLEVKFVRKLITPTASVVRKNADVMTIAKEIVKDPKTRSVYVVDNHNILLGIIPVANFAEYLFYEYIPDDLLCYKAVKPLELVTAEDIMLPPVYVKEDDTLDVAFQKMYREGLKELPVVDNEMHVIGDLNILEIIMAWIEKNSE